MIFKELRNLLDDLLREKLREPKTSIEGKVTSARCFSVATARAA